MSRKFYSYFITSAAVLCCSVALSAKDKHSKSQPDSPQDQIEVTGHLPLTSGAVTRFLITEHYRRDYLYAEHAAGNSVTLIDVTNSRQPAVLADMSYPSGASDNLVAVAGNAALTSAESPAASSALTPQTFRIMSFADPAHPTVKQEFHGVTAMATDQKRGLIFLANGDGVWVLQQKYAMDPQFEKEWEHVMLDAR